MLQKYYKKNKNFFKKLVDYEKTKIKNSEKSIDKGSKRGV